MQSMENSTMDKSASQDMSDKKPRIDGAQDILTSQILDQRYRQYLLNCGYGTYSDMENGHADKDAQKVIIHAMNSFLKNETKHDFSRKNDQLDYDE